MGLGRTGSSFRAVVLHHTSDKRIQAVVPDSMAFRAQGLSLGGFGAPRAGQFLL